MYLRGFALNDAHVYLLCIGDLVIVQHAVLKTGTIKPDWALALDENPSAVIDVDLAVVT